MSYVLGKPHKGVVPWKRESSSGLTEPKASDSSSVNLVTMSSFITKRLLVKATSRSMRVTTSSSMWKKALKGCKPPTFRRYNVGAFGILAPVGSLGFSVLFLV